MKDNDFRLSKRETKASNELDHHSFGIRLRDRMNMFSDSIICSFKIVHERDKRKR